MNHLIFVRKAYIPNFRPPVPFLDVKKFEVVGGWMVLKVDFVLSEKCLIYPHGIPEIYRICPSGVTGGKKFQRCALNFPEISFDQGGETHFSS